MRRLRRYLASITITPIGAVVLGVLVVAFGLFAFGPSSVQAPAMVAGVILLVGVVGGVPFGRAGAGAWRNPSLAERRREFGPRDHQDITARATGGHAEEELWRKERERYAQDQRSS